MYVLHPGVVEFKCCSENKKSDFFLLQKQNTTQTVCSLIPEKCSVLKCQSFSFSCFACNIQLDNYKNTLKHLKVNLLFGEKQKSNFENIYYNFVFSILITERTRMNFWWQRTRDLNQWCDKNLNSPQIVQNFVLQATSLFLIQTSLSLGTI